MNATEPARNIYTSGDYTKTHPGYHVEDSAWKTRQVASMLRRYGVEPATVCEIGCGAGEILRQVRDEMSSVRLCHGYDISHSAIELCHQRANPGLEYFCADFLSSETQHYDVVLCMDVIEHVDDYIGFLKKLRARGEYKVFHIPLELSVQTVARAVPIAEARESNGHIHYFTKETALATLSYAGYEVVGWAYTGSGVDKWYGPLNFLARYPRKMLSKCCHDLVVRVLGGYSLLVLTK